MKNSFFANHTHTLTKMPFYAGPKDKADPVGTRVLKPKDVRIYGHLAAVLGIKDMMILTIGGAVYKRDQGLLYIFSNHKKLGWSAKNFSVPIS